MEEPVNCKRRRNEKHKPLVKSLLLQFRLRDTDKEGTESKSFVREKVGQGAQASKESPLDKDEELCLNPRSKEKGKGKRRVIPVPLLEDPLSCKERTPLTFEWISYGLWIHCVHLLS